MESDLDRRKRELEELRKEEARIKSEIEKKKEIETLDIAIEAQRRRNEYLERQTLSSSPPDKKGLTFGSYIRGIGKSISEQGKPAFKKAEDYFSTHDVARGLKDEEKKKVRK